jgi:hypothetical protein
MRDLRDGGLELTLDVADTIEVRRWLLGFGGDVEVLEPLALRDAIVREAERIVERGRRDLSDRTEQRRKPLAPVGARKPPPVTRARRPARRGR